MSRPTPKTNAFGGNLGDWIKFAEKLERERDEAREERDKFRSLNESYAACWDEIRAVLGESEQGDKTCDLDRVLKAICERDEAREAIHALKRDREEWELLREAQHDRIVGEFAKVYAERDEARELLRILVGLVAYGLGQSGEEWSLDAMRQATSAIQKSLEESK